MSESSKPIWSAGSKTVTVEETEDNVASRIRIHCGNATFERQIAKLIAEAGTVFHETGLTPRVALAQIVLLRDMLSDLVHLSDYGPLSPNADIWTDARAALANTERKT